ncbi:SEL1-like repeat protein [Azotobacter beijerinckii]|uniref:Alginate biosynthesis protein AlgK n=1 Tax=Azotobacter beijerinckii TaxID=170623 RepID=A0A1I4CP31_9GAMM|nr:SEL1-like repeat protein [Azotobacter beijerinckii]SFB23896.1 alginate biosynthesis protein AlgK [Azotobacter beijerinckii]SFK82400.1 alginate biosynthesis protein AlgK [Azotobacter beijerinckii]
MNLTKPLLLSALAGLTACANLDLPDQRLAKEALQRGDAQTAERHFRQLAEMGFTDAQLGLADMQLASGDPEQLRKAEQTYRMALDASPRAKARLGKLLAYKPTSSEAEKREAAQLLGDAFAAGEEGVLLPLAMLYLKNPQSFPDVSLQQRIDQWRAAGHPQADIAQIVLYRTQGSYDQHLDEIERICQKRLADYGDCYVELATVYLKRGQNDRLQALVQQQLSAYRSGTVPAQLVMDVAGVLSNPQLGQSDEKTARALLEEIAPAHPAAWVGLARLLYDFPGTGDTDQLLDYLERGRAAAQPAADLLLGRLYYEGKLLPQDPFKAEEHFLKAAATENSANYYLGQLYRRGFLGKVYPQKAVDRLLTAARGGQASADYALGQLFSQGRGIRIDRANAYVFARLAVLQGRPDSEPLLQEIESRITPEERSRGERLLRDEQQVRYGAWQAPTQLHALQNEQEAL